ncbi:hypothetical protein HBIAX_02995 [Achromobacter xylosoxidans]|nr:hypothetical protein HBIAX_02995 [Achromobacter xylosoxidans]
MLMNADFAGLAKSFKQEKSLAYFFFPFFNRSRAGIVAA